MEMVTEAELTRLAQENIVAVGVREEENGTWSFWVSGPSGIQYVYPKSGSFEEAQQMCEDAAKIYRQV
jgi:hypothetical protein